MNFADDNLDGVLHKLYRALLNSPNRNCGSRGENVEILGVSITLRKPRARLSRSEDRGHPFSALGELLWYLSGRNDLQFIKEYIPRYADDAEKDGTLHGAYGPRIMGTHGAPKQLENVLSLLRNRSGSRRAVIQLFDASDLVGHFREIPCTTSLQFHLRNGVLHMSTTMRSNDAYWGLPHDIFCFTMLQEMVARALGAELGQYMHFVGSMHVYDRQTEGLTKYVEEGIQQVVEMPPMPEGNPFDLAEQLLSAEAKVRRGDAVDAGSLFVDPYWADILRLLQAFWASGDGEKLDLLKAQFAHPLYREYLEERRTKKRRSFLALFAPSKDKI